jgi:hypothetical protein
MQQSKGKRNTFVVFDADHGRERIEVICICGLDFQR